MALGLHRPVLGMDEATSVDDGDLKVGKLGMGVLSVYICICQSNRYILYHFEDQRDFLRI